MYAYVRSTSFCPVFHGARTVPSQTGVRDVFFPCDRPCTGPCTCTCLVRRFAQFCMSHVQLLYKRASGKKNTRVTVPAVFGPCTGPCTRTCIVRRFAQFFMSHVQLLHGTGRFWSVHGSMYAYVPSTSFCLVFHVARAAPSETDVRQKNSRVTVPAVFGPCTGPCTRTCIVRRFAQFSMSHVQLLHKRASGQKVHVSWYRPSFPWVHVRVRA